MNCTKFLLAYVWEDNFGNLAVGSCTMTKAADAPMTEELMGEAMTKLREALKIPKDRKLIPMSFSLFEE